MGLNKSNGNMYSWVTHTWNTIKGKCPHDCTYCYMHKWGPQKPIRFDSKELETNLGSGNFIFVGSSCDMFADAIPAQWIGLTLTHCHNSDNAYLFQTKNPKRFLGYDWPNKTMLCTTIETNRHYLDVMMNSPAPTARAKQMVNIPAHIKRYVTIEPIMDFDLPELVALIKMCDPEQVNIGADSGNNDLPEPSKGKMLALIDELKNFTVIDHKRNLTRLLK